MRITQERISDLIDAYYATPAQGEVTFGTSGHRGSSINGTFNEPHIVAISQAICELREVSGPLFIGKDTHALSEPALYTALEVFAAHDFEVIVGDGYTPTPVISHAILTWNENNPNHQADAVILTPSHNPPEDGGFKYNPPHGGPASSDVTQKIQMRARELMNGGLHQVKRIPIDRAWNSINIALQDLIGHYVKNLAQVIRMDVLRDSGIKIGVDPMGGAAVHYWEPIADYYNISIDVVNKDVDPAFAFMPLDHDGKVRMDCSSSDAMQHLVALRDRYDISFGNDPDVDRHGIVTQSQGLLNPNHYLAVAGNYLFEHRLQWSPKACFAKTVVSSSMIDRVADHLGRPLFEVPVGFKWFVDGLLDGSCGFAGEESAGASFLRRNGQVWTTDKDGIILGLLAAEILAVTERDPGEHYQLLTERFGDPVYLRIDSPATLEQRDQLAKLSPSHVQAKTLAGEPIVEKATHASGNQESIGGLKVTTKNGWFAARPSGTENLYKIYAESFLGDDHLQRMIMEAQSIVNGILSKGESS
ncbi:MAG: phosphoglucomutase (alpha-D-glucose-1,6-bisphosphate-dependent) [Bacteroidetes bacterium]|nr:phosphoglucomutase (alpha-D-glucose-1,6-bisphosphate-dependent) [Bacteroidota bacterium]